MTAGSVRARGAGPARTPKGMHDVLWPESARWETTVARFAALVEGAGYGLALTPDRRARRRVPARHRRGQRGRRQGDVRLRGPRRPADGAAPRGHGAGRPGLRAAPPGPAVEGLVRGALVPPREPPARPLPPALPAGRGGARRRPTPTSTSRWSRWPTTSSPGSGLREVELKLHSMGDGVCKPGYVALLGAFLAERADQLCPAHRARHLENPLRVLDCKTRRVPGGHRGRAALPRPPLRPVRGPLRPGARRPGRAAASPTSSTTAWCGASTTTPARRSSSPPRRSTRPRTASAAAAATTGWSSCWAASPTPGHRVRHRRRAGAAGLRRRGRVPRRVVAARPLHAYVIDTAGGEAAVALTAELRRAGLRADRAFDGRSMKSQIKSADRSGALVALVVGAQELAEGDGRAPPAAQRRGAADRAPGCHRGRAQELLANAAFAEGPGGDVDRHLHPHLRPPTPDPTDRHRHDPTPTPNARRTNRPTAMRTHLCGVLRTGRRRHGRCASAAGWPGGASTASTSPSSTCATTRASSSASSTTPPTCAASG